VLAELNDLLRVSQRAVAAYTTAIPQLTNVGRRQTLMRFRADHQRVVTELSAAIRQGGGTPAESAAEDADGATAPAADDRAHMTTICRIARQVRARFLRAADRLDGLPAEVRERLVAAAEDLARQCEWADSQLAALGGRVPRLDRVPGIDLARRGLERLPDRLPSSRALAVGAIAAGLGFAIVATVGGVRARR